MKKAVLFMLLGTLAILMVSIDGRGQFPDVPRTNIIGGTSVAGSAFPFVVYLDLGQNFCTGSLIADNWILTAAHCVVESSGAVVSSRSLTIERGYPDDYESTEEVGRVIVHPEYDYSGAGFKNDAAIIELLKPFQSVLAVPVEILTKEQREIYGPSGSLATAVGYGRKENDAWSDGIRQVNIPLSTPEDCRQQYSFLSEEEIAHERTLCAGSAGKGINSGDSGGPLLVSTLNGWGQAGIASMRGWSESGEPVVSIYTRVPSIYDWISETIAHNSKLYFSQFAVGPGMTSDFVIFNPSENTIANAEIQFFMDQGERAYLLTGEQSMFTLHPFATLTNSPSGSVSGSAVVLSDSPLTGFVRFKASGLGTVGLLASDIASPRWLIPVRGGTFRTGISVFNVEDEEVSMRFILMNRSGGILNSSDISIPAHGKVLGFLDELFPAYFVPGQELAGQALVQTYRGDPKGLSVIAVEIGVEQGDFNVLPVVPLEF